MNFRMDILLLLSLLNSKLDKKLNFIISRNMPKRKVLARALVYYLNLAEKQWVTGITNAF